MTIQITVIDPANTPAGELRQVIAFLTQYAETPAAAAPQPPAPVATIAPADNPATGFDPASVFGDAGNVPDAGSTDISDPSIAFSAPAVPSAPSVAAASAPVLPGAVDLDTNGLPWDARIHAGTKRKNADGSWTSKRGVDETVVAQVEAQLRGLMAIPAPNVLRTGATVTPPPIPPAPPAPPAPTIAPPAPATIPPVPAGVPSGIDFGSLAKMVGELIPAGRLQQPQLEAIVAKYGVNPPQFGLLFNRPDLVPAVHADIMAAIGG